MTTALLLSLLLIQGPVTSAKPDETPAIAPLPQSHASTDGVVRMRKLHLVRPELIPYPLAYEVYC